MDVHLLVYDLSFGLVKQLSMSYLGFQLDALYHTSIELNGLEYVYDSGINLIQPGSSHLGPPLERIHLGQTSLPMDVISEFLESLRQIFTPQAYDLFRHNCNNFSNDFATFLIGKGIPDHIVNMPQAVLDSPAGRMLQPHLERMVQQRKAQQGGLLGIQNNGARSNGTTRAPDSTDTHSQVKSSVRNVGNMAELNAALEAASKSRAIVFFTSATCPPCKMLYPLYDELAAEWGDKVALIKSDVSRALDVGQRYSIRGTPTFVTFVHGKEEERWSGADASRLRSTISLLAHMSQSSHPHQSLNLPHFNHSDPQPVLYTKIPPIPKLLSKLGSTAENAAIQGVKLFVEARINEGPAQATLPDMAAFSTFLQSAFLDLPTEVLFTVVDLFRCALVDPRFSGYFVEEGASGDAGLKTTAALETVLKTVNTLEKDCPYALRLVTLQMVCNIFSSPLASDRILDPMSPLRGPLVQLISTSFLDSTHNAVRVASASLLFNLASTHGVRLRRNIGNRNGSGNGNHALLPEEDQVELVASLLEAIGQEEESPDALQGMLMALGHLAYCCPSANGGSDDDEEEGGLADLLRVLDARGTVTGKKGGRSKMTVTPDLAALIREVGDELLGKGFARK